jgi:hypothetical protein
MGETEAKVTKTANREAAKAYQDELRRKERDDAARAAVQAKLDVIGPFRKFLIETGAPNELLEKLDDWAGELTGRRDWFWAHDSGHAPPQIKLPHER